MPDSLSVVHATAAVLALTALVLAVLYVTAILVGAATVTAVVVAARPVVHLVVSRLRAAQLFTELRDIGLEGPLGRTRSRPL